MDVEDEFFATIRSLAHQAQVIDEKNQEIESNKRTLEAKDRMLEAKDLALHQKDRLIETLVQRLGEL